MDGLGGEAVSELTGLPHPEVGQRRVALAVDEGEGTSRTVRGGLAVAYEEELGRSSGRGEGPLSVLLDVLGHGPQRTA